MKILLLGRNGQMGQELSRSLLSLGQLTVLGREELDLTDLNALTQVLNQLQPDIIVNAAAYTAVDQAEQEHALAYLVNEKVVAVLAEYAQQHDALLIHYSTDYVFDGTKQGAYLESDAKNPLSVYGASKAAGEFAIVNSGCRGYIFRTSWVFSPHGHNFIKTILTLARQKEALSIVADQYGAPTSAELLSDVSLLAIHAAQKGQLAPGIYHLTANGITTWHGLACYVLEKTLAQQIEFNLVPSKIQPILSEAYPLPAVRPKNSVLDTSVLSGSLQIVLPDWSTYVDRMITQLIKMRFFA